MEKEQLQELLIKLTKVESLLSLPFWINREEELSYLDEALDIVTNSLGLERGFRAFNREALEVSQNVIVSTKRNRKRSLK